MFFVVFLFLLLLVLLYLFNFSFLLEGGFPRILGRLSILEVVDLVLFLTWGSSDVLLVFGTLFLSGLVVLGVSFLVFCSIYY